MAPSKRCLICLNYLKAKKKLIPQHSPEEQRVIIYFLRKLAWTPVPEKSLEKFLQFGKPSEWGSMCNLCEKDVKTCLDLHREIGRMLNKIVEMRRKLYDENFYEVEDEEEEEEGEGPSMKAQATTIEDCSGVNDIFSHLRHQLFSDFKEGGQDTSRFDKSVQIRYKTSEEVDGERKTHSKRMVRPTVKEEILSDDDNDMDMGNPSDQEEADDNHSDGVEEESRRTNVSTGEMEDEVSSELMEEGADDPGVRRGPEVPSSASRKKHHRVNKSGNPKRHILSLSVAANANASKGSRKRHPVWKYFSYDLTSNASKCLIEDCGSVLAKCFTTNLKKHLRASHNISLDDVS